MVNYFIYEKVWLIKIMMTMHKYEEDYKCEEE